MIPVLHSGTLSRIIVCGNARTAGSFTGLQGKGLDMAKFKKFEKKDKDKGKEKNGDEKKEGKKASGGKKKAPPFGKKKKGKG